MENTYQQHDQGVKTPGTRRCPYCGEPITDTAIKCRHCGEWLDRQPRQPNNTGQQVKRQTSAQRANNNATMDKKADEDKAKAKKLFIGAGVAAVIMLTLAMLLTYGNDGNNDIGTRKADSEETIQTGDTGNQDDANAGNDGESMAETSGTDNGPTDTEPQYGGQDLDTAPVEDMLTQWDIAHNGRDTETFAAMYANTVSYYGSKLTNRQCIANKRELFKRYKEYEQYSDNINKEWIGPGCIKLTFDKHVYYDGNSSTYRGYLFFEKDGNGTWRITRESDTTTDYNLSREGE